MPGGNLFDVVLRDRGGALRTISGIELPMPGRHNVQNALAAVAVALEMGCGDAVIQRGFAGFGGVKRRFTQVGEACGAAIIDDYAHHPVEIRAVLSAAREGVKGRVIAVVQPHRYSRLHSLFDDFCTCFNDADTVIVAPVYAAGELPVPGADRDSLVSGLKSRGHRNAVALERSEDLAGLVGGQAKPGDYVICLGAGNITQWAYALPGELAALGEQAAA